MTAYVPQVDSLDRVRDEFAQAAAKFQETAGEVLTEDQMRSTVEALTDAALIEKYSAQLPLVHRFVVAELDTDAPSKRGMARLADGDPPPRMGSKYRKQLGDDALRHEVGIGAERVILVGFAGQFAFADNPFAETSPDDVWLA